MKGKQSYNPEFIRPLNQVENQFLQVLVTQFRLRAKGRGLDLEVAFDSESPAIWLREAKMHLKHILPGKRLFALQTKIEKYFEKGKGDFKYQDDSIPFRFGNGGTLPVVRIDGKDYYCLFFRDAHPMGWNIANGGANHLSDLLHPDGIIERELREELIVVEPEHRRRYVFDWHDAHLRDHPDFALANQLWMERFRRQNFKDFEEIPLPLKWIPSFDIDLLDNKVPSFDSVAVSYDGNPAIHTGYGFININAEDFGIEFDRIAKLSVGPDAIFCDGEIVDGQLLNRVVGLFDVKKLNNRLRAGKTDFKPDRIFWNGEEHSDDDLIKVVEDYLKSHEYQKTLARAFIPRNRKLKFGLCPVTRNIIRRYLRQADLSYPKVDRRNKIKGFDIFLSFGSEDRQLAQQVYETLNQAGQHRVFFSDVTIPYGPFASHIDSALDNAWALVAVASQLRYINKPWVKYEWQSFHNDILSNRKHEETPFVAFTAGVDFNDLPRPFRQRRAVCSKPFTYKEDLLRLTELIRKP
jgi:hypothetical protein